jgi:hypothetical protein
VGIFKGEIMLKWIEKLFRKIRQKKDDNVFMMTVHINHDDLKELIDNGFTEFNGIRFDYYQNTMLSISDDEIDEVLKYQINKSIMSLLIKSYEENVLK